MFSPNSGNKSSEKNDSLPEDSTFVSFAGKGLKLDTQEDATSIVNAIRGCPNLVSLNLEGNTLGVEAASAISEALESTSNFKHAIFKDMFTGRLKHEVPRALKSLTNGIVSSSARLIELDLSDNAFGPIGMEALAPFLENEACELLRILRLNNNGLGIHGGKTLGKALHKLTHLEVFICGRNRLENPGAKAIAGALANINNLKQLEMPQNGIHFVGIEALTQAINENLKILNLSDNTMTIEGARVMALALPRAKNLEVLNLSDCLLKREGFTFILKALKESGILIKLRQMNFQGNEIGGQQVVDLILETFYDSTQNFTSLALDLSCNNFGESNCELMIKELKDNIDLTIQDDEGEDDGDDNYEPGDEEDEDEESDEDDDDEESEDEGHARRVVEDPQAIIKQYLQHPLDNLCRDFVHLASEQFDPQAMTLHEITLKDLGYLLQAIVEKDSSSYAGTQGLLAHMGLIKSEEGYHKHRIDLRGPFIALTRHVNILPKSYRDVFHLFLKDVTDRQAEDHKVQFLQALCVC